MYHYHQASYLRASNMLLFVHILRRSQMLILNYSKTTDLFQIYHFSQKS